ncbi:hypothetical protein [uncultured Parabacteroides sp.]|jgi:hypothetical protein|uniref:hypothetical protein n=1 Tax=uncultured Parabacteroides sp. TaxID=512312 RepID=UPI0025E8C38D|nr:hypothetical protein [uncultured Parabacteroides sp.]
MELKARKMDLVEAVMLLDNEKLAKAERYIRSLLTESSDKTYEMPAHLLNALLDRADENRKNGSYIEDKEMDNFIKSLG